MVLKKEIDYKASKKRWPAYLFLIFVFQSLNFISTTVCIYAILSLNWRLCFIIIVIIFMQRFVKRSQKFIHLVTKYVQPLNYFRSFKRIYEQQIPEDQASLFSLHPHSILGYCMIANMHADNSKMSQMVGLASRFILNMPIVAIPLKLWGVQSVDSNNFTKLMKQRKTIGVLPGGYEEGTLTSPKQLRVFIKNRKGFIKYALENGYTIYPVLTFNQHKAFWTFDGLKKFRLWLNHFKIPIVLFGGGFLWFFLPLDLDLITIVGKGIRLNDAAPKRQITHQEIQNCHAQYIEQIKRIHAKYRYLSNQVPLAIY